VNYKGHASRQQARATIRDPER